MEQRQSDDSNEPRTPQPATPDMGNQPTDSQPANAKPAADQRETPLRPSQRDGNQRNQPQRDNRQQNSRSGGQRDENPKNNRQDRDAGPRDAGPRDAGTPDRGPRDAGTPDRGQQERGQQDRGPKDAGTPERGQQDRNQQERVQRDASATDRAQQERGQRQDRAPRDAGAQERGPQDRGQQDRGSRDANRQERPSRDGGHNPRNDSRPTDRDRSNGNRDRNTFESRNSGNQDRQSSENGGFMDGDADSQDRSLRDAGAGIRDERLVIGISLGDYNGIGPEVILKALQYNRLQKICTPVIYGSMRVLNRYRNLLNLKDWNLNGAPTIGQISHKMTNVITCWPDQNQDIQPGQVTTDAGQAALACLQRAVDDLKEGKLDALVTAPINKYNIQSEEFKFPGHTEYLAQEFGVEDNLMFLVSERLRVGVVTGHVPLGRVRQNVTKERISQKLSLMMESLRQDFGIEKPKIAVLGLNPHAGEEGLLGNEEQDIIKPLITEWRNKGQMVFGPYPADGFFGTRSYLKFDAVLAMYHDQGLIPFKAIAFEEGVNFTAGMPAVRTSPDHGTAYDIAGKNLADETSMLQAIYTAVDVARQRKEFADLEENSLKNQSVEK